MRKDMHNVIKVRPGRGGGWAKLKPPTGDPEDFASREPMRPRVGGWNLKEHYDWTDPLRRYLASQVGRVWNDVFSDICAHNSIHSKTQLDVRDAIKYMVHTNVVFIDGEPRDSGGHGIWRDHWVHPETGILMAAAQFPRYRWKGFRKNFRQVEIDETNRYAEINGIWYRVVLAPFVRSEFEPFVAAATSAFRPVIYDVAFREELPRGFDTARDWLVREWGAAVFAVSKRQIDSREKKKVMAKLAALELASAAA